MHRNVLIRDEFGDTHRGVQHEGRSDEPSTITVNGTCWYATTWTRYGWSVAEFGEWEL